MNDVSQSRLASMLTVAVGAWLIVSPLFLTVNGAALVNVMIVGAIIALAGLLQLVWDTTMPSWVSALAAVWLAMSAFIFSAGTAFVWSTVLSAVAVFALAVWDGIEVNHMQHDRQRHLPV